MGFFRGIMGHASEIDIGKLEREFENILADNERIEKAYKVIRDMFVFTNKRLVLVDKQGLTGKKVEYHSIPYSSVSHFSVESMGHLDLEAELNIWVRGMTEPISKEFKEDKNIFDVQRTLANYVLK